MMRRKIPLQDVLLIAGLLLVGVVFGLILLLTRSEGAQVQVRVDGQIVKTFSLSQDTEYLIEGVSGGTDQLIIKDGKAWISEASCPDHLCINMGKIHSKGQSIVCLPNKVVVEVIGDDGDDSGVDRVTG